MMRRQAWARNPESWSAKPGISLPNPASVALHEKFGLESTWDTGSALSEPFN
jgi:hypothetical protein